jgi:hypothetical protein
VSLLDGYTVIKAVHDPLAIECPIMVSVSDEGSITFDLWFQWNLFCPFHLSCAPPTLAALPR